jgi:hypothetical protein
VTSLLPATLESILEMLVDPARSTLDCDCVFCRACLQNKEEHATWCPVLHKEEIMLRLDAGAERRR